MRVLLLLRHAKAVASSPEGDFGRGLAPRGARQSAAFGRWLKGQSFAPDRAIVSPARRTMETTDNVLAALGADVERQAAASLYNARAGDILDVVRDVPDASRRLLVVGHNPGIAELAVALSGSGDPSARDSMARRYPTCACAILRFDIGAWRAIGPGGGELSMFVEPRTIDAPP
jgi:phosphohistidine phosphatase